MGRSFSQGTYPSLSESNGRGKRPGSPANTPRVVEEQSHRVGQQRFEFLTGVGDRDDKP
jgi:hypothetical protein